VDFQVRISETSLAEFESILEFSWTNFPATAERFGVSLLNNVGLLRAFLYAGGLVMAVSGVRQLIHTPIVVYYRVRENPNVVEILYFRHASRRPPRF
jgi:plasmid stabilization system protein ParE